MKARNLKLRAFTERQTREQLEVCPFCANVPNVFQVVDGRYNLPAWVIECKDMGCIFRRSSPNVSLTRLKEDWNKRTASEPGKT
jgi:hypothetical protein